jgi:hypothetical protein
MPKSRLLLMTALLALLISSTSPVSAQGFADLPGLERGVVRAWLAPATSETAGDSTPAVGPVVTTATPVPALDPATMSATIFLSIGVFEFDSVESAGAGFDSLAGYVMQVSDGDPQFAGGSRTEPGMGEQSVAATNTMEQEGIPFSYLLTVVRQGSLVYLLQGTFVRLDPADEVERLVSGLLAGAAEDGPGTYDEAGGSTGGLWSVFAHVEPVIVPGTEILDDTIT